MAQITINELRKDFGDFTAVQASTFTIEDGEFFMLLGPSGCGKTTTLRMIAGLELPTSGEIKIAGNDVSQLPASKRDIAFVFQMFALYPHMNVRRNISYPLVSQGMKRADVKRKVNEVADILGIQNIMDSPVGGLSGGDRQRVALGRAIVREPQAFLMDEPLGALDSEFREHMAEELRALHDRVEGTTVYVTHDQLEAMQMGDKLIVMNEGVVEQFGTPQEVYDKPATRFVAGFLGSPAMNFLDFESTISEGDSSVNLGGIQQAVPRQHAGVSGAMALGVRPEHINLDDAAALRGRVLATEYMGTTQIVTCETELGAIKARVTAREHVAIDSTVGLGLTENTITLFDAQGMAVQSELNAHG